MLFYFLGYAQSKKKQIEILNNKIDSINQVVVYERNVQKNYVRLLEIQESQTKQKIDSLSAELKSLEDKIISQQNTTQFKNSELEQLKNEFDKQKASLDYFIELNKFWTNDNQSESDQFEVGELSEGKRIFCKNGKMGVIESSGKIILTPFDCIENTFSDENIPKFQNGKCFVFKKNEDIILMNWMDENYRMIELPSHAIFPLGYCNTNFDFKNDRYPLLRNTYETSGSESWVFINSKGEKVFDFNYGSGGCTAACNFMPEFSEGLCLFEDSLGKCGYLNDLGQIAIPCKYYGASNFSEGIACVIEKIDSKNYCFSFINLKGEKVFSRTFNVRPINELWELRNHIACSMRDQKFTNGKYKINFWDPKKQKDINAIINNKGDIIEYIKVEETIEEEQDENSYKIGTLEIALTDLSKNMNLSDAEAACANMGSGWRLPTNRELEIMFQNRNKIGGFKSDNYWSGSEPEQNDFVPSSSAYFFDFKTGVMGDLSSGDNPGDFLFFVRPVRSVN